MADSVLYAGIAIGIGLVLYPFARFAAFMLWARFRSGPQMVPYCLPSGRWVADWVDAKNPESVRNFLQLVQKRQKEDESSLKTAS